MPHFLLGQAQNPTGTLHVHPHYVRTCSYYTLFWAKRQPKTLQPDLVLKFTVDVLGSLRYNKHIHTKERTQCKQTAQHLLKLQLTKN